MYVTHTVLGSNETESTKQIVLWFNIQIDKTYEKRKTFKLQKGGGGNTTKKRTYS